MVHFLRLELSVRFSFGTLARRVGLEEGGGKGRQGGLSV